MCDRCGKQYPYSIFKTAAYTAYVLVQVFVDDCSSYFA